MDDMEMEHRMTEVEQRSKSNTKRIDKLEESTEAINRLATSMELMAERQEQVVKKVDKLDAKVETIEQKPAKRWDGMVEKIIYGVVGALMTAMGTGIVYLMSAAA